MAAIGMGVVDHAVHVAADQLFRPPAQQTFSGGVNEGGMAVGVDAVDAFAGGPQDQLVLPFDIAEEAFHPPPLGDATLEIGVGFGIDLAAMTFFQIRNGQQDQPGTGPVEPCALVFDRDLAAIRTAGGQTPGDRLALVQNGLGEDHQRRYLALVQFAHPPCDERLGGQAEQPACRRVGMQDQIGHRIEDQHRPRAGGNDHRRQGIGPAGVVGWCCGIGHGVLRAGPGRARGYVEA